MDVMTKRVKERLQEEYEIIQPYLNDENTCTILHDMCEMCELWNGLENHDYSECREKPCFISYLGLSCFESEDSWNLNSLI